jgi:predicted ArsR family transcriptional regulator
MGRLAEVYRDKLTGATINERMAALAGLMHERDVPFEVQTSDDENQLPILRALACPYPDLAEQDRAICSLEKMLFSEILGEGVRLSACRLDGANGCTFELSAASPASV